MRLALLAASAGLALAPFPAAAVDLTDDGRPLPAADSEGSGRLLHAMGGVTLPSAPSWQSTLDRAVGGLAFGDVDGDGDLDLCSGNYQQTGFPQINDFENQIFFNSGGSLETTPSWVSAVEHHTGDARVADIDGDGYEDVLFVDGGTGFHDSVVHYGGPGGPSTTPDWSAVGTVWGVGGALGDLDADGFVDVVLANQGLSPLPYRPCQIYLGSALGLPGAPSWQSADSTISNTAALADVDRSSEVAAQEQWQGDDVTSIFRVPHFPVAAFDDVVLSGVTPSQRWTLERASGRIHLSAPLASGQTLTVDYRHADYPDVAFARWVNFATAIYGNSSGTIPTTPTWTTGDPSATDRGVAFSDVDADDDLDMGLGNSGDPTTIWRNDGGTLTSGFWSADTSLYFGTQDMAWGDVDGDGDEDLATIEFGNGHLRVFLNVGGTLETIPSWFYDFSTSASALAWGDVNGDGYLDLAAGTARGPVVLFLNEAATAAPEVGPGARARGGLVASPSPFRESTTIRFVGARAPDAGDVEVIDASGRVVRRLPAAGPETTWDGRDDAGRDVAAGVYFLRQETSAGPRTGRSVRLR
jgi:hypothetical protein